MLAQSLQPLDQSVPLYRRMLHFWELHLGRYRSRPAPARRHPPELSAGWSSICSRSSSTSACTTFVCAFSQAEQLSLDLPLPLWAGNALGELGTAVAESEA